MRKLVLLSAVAALAVAVPAVAKQPPNHPNPTTSAKCTPHKVAWIVSGTLVKWSMTLDANGKTFSGSLSVTRTNHHAAGADVSAMTFPAISGAHVLLLGQGVNSSSSPAAGSKVKLIGDVTALAQSCSTTGFTPTVTVDRVVVHEAHSK
jgi:hypothetical protein